MIEKAWRTALVSAAAGGLVFSAGTASALPYIPEVEQGNVTFKFENVEELPLGSLAPGTDQADGVEDNWGTARITSINDGNSPTSYWADVQPGQVTAMFWGLDIKDVTNNGNDGFNFNLAKTADAGMGLWWDETDDYAYGSPGDRTATNGFPTVTDGTPLVEFDWTSGILPGDPDTVVRGSIDGLSDPVGGDAKGYLSVVEGSGPWASSLDTNGFAGGNADIFLQNDFRSTSLSPANGDDAWALDSDDPTLATVPLPGTLNLLAMGFLALAGLLGLRRSPGTAA